MPFALDLAVGFALQHRLTITPYEYTSTQCLMAIGTAKDIDSGITRLKICAGELLTRTYKYAKPAARGPVNVQLVADLMHIVLRSDHILEIPDTGVVVFDKLIIYRYDI